MKSDGLNSFADSCLQGNKAPCVCSCPLNPDIPAFIEKVQKNDFQAAYQIYRNYVLFPGIVCKICGEPCNGPCGTDISLLMLEDASVRYAKDKTPIKLAVPRKKEKIAVIGSGLSGLSCALKLAMKRYNVTVYEKENKIGGSLRGKLDSAVIADEIELQFRNLSYELVTNHEITDLELPDYDAVYIATGENGNDFGLSLSVDHRSYGTVWSKYFLGGRLIGADDIEAISQGIIASRSIEKFLKVGSMNGIPETFRVTESKLNIAFDLDKGKPNNIRKGPLTREEAVKEAGRCIRCDCTTCRDGCELMKWFGKLPKRMVSDAIASLYPLSGLAKRGATRMVASCNMCSYCGRTCPEGIDMGEFFKSIRQTMLKDGSFPPAFHDFYIKDMGFSNETAFLCAVPGNKASAAYLFFPGCQLSGADPLCVENIYSYLRGNQPDTAIVSGCCGIPAEWAGEGELFESAIKKIKTEWERLKKPKMIFACPTCQKTFKRYLPQIEGESVYDAVLRYGLPAGTGDIREKISIFDPCSSGDNAGMQEAVRQLAKALGAEVEELPFSGKRAQCCGFGGHIYPANPEFSDHIIKERGAQSKNPYLTYCINCHYKFLLSGKESRHLLEIIFGGRQNTIANLSEKRENRLKLKESIEKELFGIQKKREKSPYERINLTVPEALLKEMDRRMILLDDVKYIIYHAEQNYRKLVNGKAGSFISHLSRGNVTYWVEYKAEADGFQLLRAYCHRMQIEEEA